jgi:hypothetical protein
MAVLNTPHLTTVTPSVRHFMVPVIGNLNALRTGST